MVLAASCLICSTCCPLLGDLLIARGDFHRAVAGVRCASSRLSIAGSSGRVLIGVASMHTVRHARAGKVAGTAKKNRNILKYCDHCRNSIPASSRINSALEIAVAFPSPAGN